MAPPYHWTSDPSHGWLVVPIQDVVESDFEPSSASFADLGRELAYLEEDCDAPGFLAAIGISRADARRWPVRCVKRFDRTLPRWHQGVDAA